ncbi:MAG: FHA domain-containing protein, partial [Bdellovibrionota bacterium]
MNINVLKNNELIAKFDLSKEIQGVTGQGVTFFIGRAQHCHVLLDDMQISREHAQLNYRNSEWFIKKNSPYNELRLNGSDVSEAKLKNGDLITIGQYILSFTIPEYSKSDEADDKIGALDRALKFEEKGKETTAVENVEAAAIVAEKGEGDRPDSTQTSTATATATATADDLDVGPEAGKEPGGEAPAAEGIGDVNLGQAFDEGPQATEQLPSATDAIAPDESFPMQEVEEADGTKLIQSFAKVELELFGEFAPYDRYVVDSKETFIGRDTNKCQIILNDPEVSSVHAVIRKSKIGLALEDLQSGNGTILNGGRINKVDLSNNDEFIIGSTTFTVKISSDFMHKEEKRLMPVEENQVIEVEEIVEEVVDQSVDSLLAGKNVPEEKSFIKRILKDPQKRKKAIIGIVVLLGAMLMLD